MSNDTDKSEELEREKKRLDGLIVDIKKLMEEYANGGFDKIRAKLELDSTFFENNDNCFIDLLDEK